jgi:hypothetical protein
MALKAQLLTLSGLETELGRDRRTLGKLLSNVKPDGKSGGRDAWFIATVLKALQSQDSEGLNPAGEKARLDKARADLAEMELAERTGRLVSAEQIEAAWTAIATEVRTKLLMIPAAAAPRISPKMTTAEIEAVFREHIDDALAAISGAVIVEDGNQAAGVAGAGRGGAPVPGAPEAVTSP